MLPLISPQRKRGKLSIDSKVPLFDAVPGYASKVGPFGVCGGVEIILFNDTVFV